MSLDQKLDVSLPLCSLLCPGCSRIIAELNDAALSRSFSRHIRKCQKLLNGKSFLEWKAQGILDEMLTMMITDFLTDRIQKITYDCNISIKSLEKADELAQS